jgi:outer membrane receptor for Fe3+-dicitrate
VARLGALVHGLALAPDTMPNRLDLVATDLSASHTAGQTTVPSAVTVVTDTEIEQQGTGSIQQTLQAHVPGIIISDAAGNPLRAELSYRGFDASPVSGRAQAIAVYQNGVRINEVFGDVVN